MVRTKEKKSVSSLLKHCALLFVCILFILLTSGRTPANKLAQKRFASPEQAVNALVGALKTNDTEALTTIFGPGSEDLIFSGDPVADKAARDRFVDEYEEKNRVEEEGPDKVIVYVGRDDWPFPIPIVKKQRMWEFDAEEGREEMLARRIGRNEMSAIKVCLAYVDAQREYAFNDRNGDGFLEYAQKLGSDPGERNGLYWKVKEGEDQSPLGPLLAAAQEKGYSVEQSSNKSTPYFGYFYKILSAQGKNAPGGAYDYVVRGKMIGGFAMVAFPAKYDSSGVMTFIVNQDGVVYEKDLGPDTEKVAEAMDLFDPDSSWKKVDEHDTRMKE